MNKEIVRKVSSVLDGKEERTRTLADRIQYINETLTMLPDSREDVRKKMLESIENELLNLTLEFKELHLYFDNMKTKKLYEDPYEHLFDAEKRAMARKLELETLPEKL